MSSEDATERAAQTHELADTHVNGDSVVMGFAHVGGVHYAQTHLVVPGDSSYLQSIDEYLGQQR